MANFLTILSLPNENLRKQSLPVTPEEISTPEFQSLCDDMIATMYDDDGIGLAAPQIDKRIRLITIGKDALADQTDLPFSKKEDLVLINPEIETYSWKTNTDEEGCLSVPGYAGLVERHISITLRATLRDNSSVTFTAKNYFARVLQHEIDHLNGILYVDRAKEVWKFDRKENHQL